MVAWHLHVDLETEQGIGDQISAPIHRPLSPGFSPRMGSTCGRQMAPSLLELLPSGPGRLVHLPQPLHHLTPTPVLLGAFSPHTEGLGGLSPAWSGGVLPAGRLLQIVIQTPRLPVCVSGRTLTPGGQHRDSPGTTPCPTRMCFAHSAPAEHRTLLALRISGEARCHQVGQGVGGCLAFL